ncbi:hypothetical protein NDU88_006875 [Pleurodeles waltl]|uniref:Uncharacterized protein n=1 Tax=Pleurodeles waltl TaxID=8319 RepID=A0AAV7QN69_PLEWA|nr:hypothetical protein NDU88_006875 [Pleurodeles waltl]
MEYVVPKCAYYFMSWRSTDAHETKALCNPLAQYGNQFSVENSLFEPLHLHSRDYYYLAVLVKAYTTTPRSVTRSYNIHSKEQYAPLLEFSEEIHTIPMPYRDRQQARLRMHRFSFKKKAMTSPDYNSQQAMRSLRHQAQQRLTSVQSAAFDRRKVWRCCSLQGQWDERGLSPCGSHVFPQQADEAEAKMGAGLQQLAGREERSAHLSSCWYPGPQGLTAAS